MFHEHLWCSKDLRSLLFYFARSWCVRIGTQPVMSCHVWKCPDATNVANVHVLLLKIILEVLKDDLFEGEDLQYLIRGN